MGFALQSTEGHYCLLQPNIPEIQIEDQDMLGDFLSNSRHTKIINKVQLILSTSSFVLIILLMPAFFVCAPFSVFKYTGTDYVFRTNITGELKISPVFDGFLIFSTYIHVTSMYINLLIESNMYQRILCVFA